MQLSLAGGPYLKDRNVRTVKQSRAQHDRGGGEYVDLTGQQRDNARLRLGVELEFNPIRKRRRSPIVRIADEARPHARDIGFQPERPSSHELGLIITAI